MSRTVKIIVLSMAVAIFTLLAGLHDRPAQGQNKVPGDSTEERKRIQKGLEIAPVPLNLKGKDVFLVGLGSYIVNAQGACSDCHTCPTYTPGHNPFQGGDGQINSANYLAGGVPFGPVRSANITPDASGKPHGLTFEEFLTVIRTGREPDDPNEILQVMPWPIFRNMTDHDLRAIYEYLSSIPHAEPGSCGGPGQ